MVSSRLQKFIIAGICLVLCVALTAVAMLIPGGEDMLCPMHFCVLLCGLLCGWQFGLICGFAAPLLTVFLTGYPEPAYVIPMMLELSVYGLAAPIAMKLLRLENIYAKLYISLVAAMLSGRVAAAMLSAFILFVGESVPEILKSYFVTCLPGVALQLVLIPAVYLLLCRVGIVEIKRDMQNETDYYYYEDE